MEWPELGERADAGYFDEIYRRAADPWRYADDPYEQEKYARQLDWLTEGGARRFARGLEVGCSVGVFTRAFAEVCDRLDAFDLSPEAVRRETGNLSEVANVHLATAAFPDRAAHPPGAHDAVTIAEVLYYFDLPGLAAATAWLADALAAGARVVVCDFVHPDRAGFGGEVVHDVLAKELRRWHRRGERVPATGGDDQGRAYRIDLFATD